MSSTNFRNVTFLVILLVLLSATCAYITFSKYWNLPIYADLFHKED